MRCDRCGRDNEESLVFCQDCGARLPKEGPRPSGPKRLTPSHRPQAPVLAMGTERASGTTKASKATGWITCQQCHTRNELAHKYCVVCGGGLHGDGAIRIPPDRRPVGPPSPEPPPSPQPSPGLGGGTDSAEDKSVKCPRCGTDSPGGDAYCKSCGYHLASVSPSSVPPPRPTGSDCIQTQLLASSVSSAGHQQLGTQPAIPAALVAEAMVRAAEPESPPSAAAPDGPARKPLPIAADASPVPLVNRIPAAKPTSQTPVVSPSKAAEESEVHIAPLPPIPSPSPGVGAGVEAPSAISPQPAVVAAAPLPAEVPVPSPAAANPAPLTPTPTALNPGFAGDPNRTEQYAAQGQRARLARVVILRKDGSEGPSFPIFDVQADFGAEEGAVQLRDDPYISDRHGRLQRRGGRWYLRDLGSVNGIYLKLRNARPLSHGDQVLLGQQVLRFERISHAEGGLGVALQHGVEVFGTPKAPRFARLCQRTVEGVTRDIFHIHRNETTLGRESADIVFTDDPYLSRRHAVLRRDPHSGDFTLEDLGSSNGTFYALGSETEVQHGDVLRVGLHMLKLEFDNAGNGPQGVR